MGADLPNIRLPAIIRSISDGEDEKLEILIVEQTGHAPPPDVETKTGNEVDDLINETLRKGKLIVSQKGDRVFKISFPERTLYVVSDESYHGVGDGEPFRSAIREGCDHAFKEYVTKAQWIDDSFRPTLYYEIASGNIVMQIATFSEPSVTALKVLE